MSIKEQEILGVSKLKPEDRYKYLIKRVADFEEIWVLFNEEEGFALNEEKNGDKFILVWPFKEFSDLWIKGEFENFISKNIDIYYFIDEVLPKLTDNEINILSFPIYEGFGLKVTNKTFKNDLMEEMAQYE